MRIYVAISSVLETACFHRQYACKCWLASPPGVSHAPVRARTRLNGNLVQLVMVDGAGFISSTWIVDKTRGCL